MALSAYRRALSALGDGLGNWLFSTAVCLKAPYFLTIRPTVIMLEPGHAKVRMPNSWLVKNHLSTTHAIAQCNLVECEAPFPYRTRCACFDPALPVHFALCSHYGPSR
jgi:hypothetical protein